MGQGKPRKEYLAEKAKTENKKLTGFSKKVIILDEGGNRELLDYARKNYIPYFDNSEDMLNYLKQ